MGRVVAFVPYRAPARWLRLFYFACRRVEHATTAERCAQWRELRRRAALSYNHLTGGSLVP